MNQDSELAELPQVLNSEAITLAHAPSNTKRSAVIIFHGMTGTPSEMSLLARHLYDRGFHVHVPCLSGHGTAIEDLCVVQISTWQEDIELAFSRARELAPEKVFVVGLSFGAMLGLSLMVRHPAEIMGAALAAPPIRLASRGNYLALSALSYLPEFMLSHLWTVPKKRRKKNYLFLPHSAYPAHSVGGLARLIKIRRVVLRNVRSLTVPTLVVQDPFDHHLAATSGFQATDGFTSGLVLLSLLPGAEHEVFIGHQHERACIAVSDFFLSLSHLGVSCPVR